MKKKSLDVMFFSLMMTPLLETRVLFFNASLSVVVESLSLHSNTLVSNHVALSTLLASTFGVAVSLVGGSLCSTYGSISSGFVHHCTIRDDL